LYRTLAEKLVDPERPGSLNQALMELGATVCTAQAPSCDTCPVKLQCLAYKEFQNYKAENKSKLTKGKITSTEEEDVPTCSICGDVTPTESVTKYPKKAKKNEQREESVAVTLLEHVTPNNPPKYLLVQRPSTGLLASLWEFPQLVVPSTEDNEEDAEEEEIESPKKKKKASTTELSSETIAKLDDYLADTLGFSNFEIEQRSSIFINEIVLEIPLATLWQPIAILVTI
jgi:A/G-specific adenine glycosylase